LKLKTFKRIDELKVEFESYVMLIMIDDNIIHLPQGLLAVILSSTTSCYRVWVFQNWSELDLKLWLLLLRCRRMTTSTRYGGRLRWMRGSENNVYLSHECSSP